MATGSVEVVYRGVFQKNLAKNICRGIVFAAKKQGKVGIAFGRYSDSPERNGIPAKQFAVVADSDEITEQMKAHVRLGDALGLAATPSFIIDGVAVLGFPGRYHLQALVDASNACGKVIC